MDTPLVDGEIEEISPEEAFAILGNETRMETLRVLWRREEACSFTELSNEVAPDAKGNFNYHLEQLTGHFVRKREDGYTLRYAGEQVVRAVLTGTITSDPSVPVRVTTERCLFCGTPVEMAYDEEVISVRCPECEGAIGGEFPDGTCMEYEFPPAGLVGREDKAVIDAAHVFYDSKIAPMLKGVCPECSGRIEISFVVCSDHAHDIDGICPTCDTRYEVWATHRCENCLYSRRFPPWFAALNHPTAVAFFERHGMEEKVPFRKLTWDNQEFMRDISGTVVETDPYRFEVTIPVADETLVMVIDDRLDVESVSLEDESV